MNPDPNPISPLEDLKQLHRHARDLGYVAVPRSTWQRLEDTTAAFVGWAHNNPPLCQDGYLGVIKTKAFTGLTAARAADAEREGMIL